MGRGERNVISQGGKLIVGRRLQKVEDAKWSTAGTKNYLDKTPMATECEKPMTENARWFQKLWGKWVKKKTCARGGRKGRPGKPNANMMTREPDCMEQNQEKTQQHGGQMERQAKSKKKASASLRRHQKFFIPHLNGRSQKGAVNQRQE